MAIRKHDLVVDRNMIRHIDYTMPKLKYAVSFRKIIRWLENFESHDVRLAIDFLFFLEYIDTAELTFRMNEQLKYALKEIPEDYNKLIFPGVATYPKSTEVISYILKDTPIYKARQRKDRLCIITRDLLNSLIINEDTAVIFFDDFVGSGKSFEKGYDTKTGYKASLDSLPFIKQRFLVSSVCMEQGRSFINSKYPEIEIKSEFREKIFNSATSPFKISNNISQMKRFAVSYGKTIPTTQNPPFNTPLGFDQSESLVAFNHTTPNNTLPIIWGSANWYPIFPRFATEKMMQSKEIKKEVAYYFGIMNRLGIDLYTDESIIVKGAREIKYNSFTDHALLCVMKLQLDGYEMPSICQLLGITISEYKTIINYGKTKKIIGQLGKINSKGIEFYSELMKKVRSKRFIKKDKLQFEMKHVNYMPKSFGGKS